MAPWISLVLMVIAGLGLVLRHDMLPIIGFDLGIASAVVGIAGLLVFSGRADPDLDEPRTTAINYGPPMIAATLAVFLFAVYTFSNVIIDTMTGKTTTTASQHTRPTANTPPRGRVALRLTRQPNGLFSARARLNGSATTMTVDTGAATIVLTGEDARRAGIDMDDLEFSVPVQTANGTVFAASVQLQRVFVGPLGAADVAALVTRPGQLDFSLLGMSFLNRLRSYEVEGNHLTLES